MTIFSQNGYEIDMKSFYSKESILKDLRCIYCLPNSNLKTILSSFTFLPNLHS